MPMKKGIKSKATAMTWRILTGGMDKCAITLEADL